MPQAAPAAAGSQVLALARLLGMLTARVLSVQEHRQHLLAAAPEHFVRGCPKAQELPGAVWINKPVDIVPSGIEQGVG